MALPAVIALNGMRGRFTLHQHVLRNNRRIRCPVICAIPLHIPLRQPIDHLLQRGLVTPATLPIQQLPGVLVQGFPDPELLPLFLEVILHLIQLEDERFPCGLWLLLVLFGLIRTYKGMRAEAK